MPPALARALALAGALLALAGPPAAGQSPEPPPPSENPEATGTPWPPIAWRRSRALGRPWAGRLVRGVQLPAGGRDFFTWDFPDRWVPNRAWRRWGTDRLVATVLAVVVSYRRDDPFAPRVGIADLSRPRGGPFGARFGGLGHASHQNGLDVDVLYPRRDGLERAPRRPSQIDRERAQDLVDRFVAAGAEKVFVGPRTGLRGPPRIVVRLAHHDDHMHVRIPRWLPRVAPELGTGGGEAAPATGAGRSQVVGRSARGRAIRASRRGDPDARRKLLVVGCIHGNECAGKAVTRRLRALPPVPGSELWLVDDLNPDGSRARTRQNARGVDLNRNFSWGWRPIGEPGDTFHSGPEPFSEPESRAARDLILRLRPAVTVWYHQPLAQVDLSGGDLGLIRRYARVAGLPARRIPRLPGTATRWQNRHLPRSTAFVVELPDGRMSAAAVRRHARGVRALARAR